MYEGHLVRLRELRITDAEKCVKWLNDLDTAHRINGGGPMPYTIENERDFIARFSGRKDDQNHFGIETYSGEFLGVCSYSEVNWKNRNCMIGWFIGDPSFRGKGYGSDMIRMLLKVCFYELNMHKVSLEAFGYNEPAIRLYTRLGFVKEGEYRDNAFAMGRYWNDVRFSMLKTEYQALYGGED